MTKLFGELITQYKQKLDIRKTVHKDTSVIDYLFKNSRSTMEKLMLGQSERTIALDKLRNLTTQLQNNRLKYNKNSDYEFLHIKN